MTSRSEYEDYTVADLQDFLRDRELPVSGTKDELVDRLVEDDESEESESVEAAVAEDPAGLPDGDPAANRPAEPEIPEDTTCEGSGRVMGRPVPEEQRHPVACPVCGKNFDLEPLDPEADPEIPPEEDVLPDHDDIRLVPEEPAEPDTPPEIEPQFVQGREEDLPRKEVKADSKAKGGKA